MKGNMIILDCKQGDVEWQAARVGIPTSSNFDKILTTKGEPSKQSLKYLYTLSGEKIIGRKEESFQSATMLRGIETETEARMFYEITEGIDVVQVGICYRDKRKLYASSPDGLVGKEGLLEIKAPLLSTHVSYIVEGKLVEDYWQQLQGQLFVTGRKWVDIMSYYPGMKPVVVRVIPDSKFINALEAELISFCEQLDKITERIKSL